MSESNITPMRSLDQLVRSMHRKFDKLIDTQEYFRTARLEAALLLQEIRQRVEEGEAGDQNAIEWWRWYEENFPQRSRRDAERLLAIAAAENPIQAYFDANTRNAEYQRDYREREKQKIAALSAAAYGKSGNTKVESRAKPHAIVVVPDPPKPAVDKARAEAGIQEFLRYDLPTRAYFVRRLRQVYKYDVIDQ